MESEKETFAPFQNNIWQAYWSTVLPSFPYLMYNPAKLAVLHKKSFFSAHIAPYLILGGGGFGDDSDAGRRGPIGPPYKNGGDDDGRGGPQKGGGLGDNGDVKGRGKPLSGLGGQGDDTPKANYQSPLSTLPRGASAFGDDGTLPRSGRTSG